jgi:hypothetical protein
MISIFMDALLVFYSARSKGDCHYVLAAHNMGGLGKGEILVHLSRIRVSGWLFGGNGGGFTSSCSLGPKTHARLAPSNGFLFHTIFSINIACRA